MAITSSNDNDEVITLSSYISIYIHTIISKNKIFVLFIFIVFGLNKYSYTVVFKDKIISIFIKLNNQHSVTSNPLM